MAERMATGCSCISLSHEVLVAALLGRLDRPVDARDRPLLHDPGEVGHAHRVGVQVRHVPLLEEDDPTGMAEHRGDIGREQVLALAEADDEGHVVARPDEPVGLAPVEDRDGIGAVRLAQRGPQRVRDVARVRLLHEMGEHLGVGLRAEPVAPREEPVAEVPEVLDDAVVDDRDLARAVGVGVGVEVVRATVRRPAGMGEADRRRRGCRVEQRRAQVGQLARALLHEQLAGRRSRGRCRPSRTPGTRGARGHRAGWGPHRAVRCIRRCRTSARPPVSWAGSGVPPRSPRVNRPGQAREPHPPPRP